LTVFGLNMDVVASLSKTVVYLLRWDQSVTRSMVTSLSLSLSLSLCRCLLQVCQVSGYLMYSSFHWWNLAFTSLLSLLFLCDSPSSSLFTCESALNYTCLPRVSSGSSITCIHGTLNIININFFQIT